MKNQQQQAAREFYFNTNLSKTEIAQRLSITRRTVYQWSVDGNWDKLRESARHMPAIIAEKCYYLIGHFTDHLLSAESRDMAITKQEVDMLHKLTITLNKIKRGSTVADNMETFTYFLERMQRRDPELAEMVAPHVEEYISARRSKDEHDFLLDGFTETGHLPHSNNDAEERLLDEMEAESLNTHDHTRTETSHAHNPPPPQPRSTATTSPLRSEQVKQQASSNSNPRPQPVRHHEPIRPVHTPLKPNSTGHRQLVNATAKAA